jgi:hypothetical protein
VQTAPPAGEHAVTLAAGDVAAGRDFGQYRRLLRVVERRLFYNNSAFDGRSAAAGPADDAAVATDKAALLPGAQTSFANLSSYTRGINGVMIDVAELPADPTPADFSFKVPSPLNPSAWVDAPAPTGFSVRPLADPADPSLRRVTFTWPDGAVRNTWLQVAVLANAATRRAAPDVFYFGSLVGETGDRAAVSGRDVVAVRNALPARGVPVTNRHDIDRNGRVDALDVLAVRRNVGKALPPPVFPAAAPPAAPTHEETSPPATQLLKQQTDRP